MSTTHPQSTRVQGVHRWGVVELPDPMATARSGIARYRLWVFPPGTNSDELRHILLLRRWRTFGAFGAGCMVLVDAALWPGWTAAALVLGVYVLVLGYALAVSGRLRRATRRLTVAKMSGGGDEETRESLAELSRHLNDLLDLDDQLKASAITEVQYESAWGAVYEELD